VPGRLPGKGAFSNNTVISSSTYDNPEHVCIWQQILKLCEKNIIWSARKRWEHKHNWKLQQSSLKINRPARYIISYDTAQLNNNWVPVHMIASIDHCFLQDYTFFPSAHGQPPTQATFSAKKHTWTDLKDWKAPNVCFQTRVEQITKYNWKTPNMWKLNNILTDSKKKGTINRNF
jgi:hypothetical protein